MPMVPESMLVVQLTPGFKTSIAPVKPELKEYSSLLIPDPTSATVPRATYGSEPTISAGDGEVNDRVGAVASNLTRRVTLAVFPAESTTVMTYSYRPSVKDWLAGTEESLGRRSRDQEPVPVSGTATAPAPSLFWVAETDAIPLVSEAIPARENDVFVLNTAVA
ncbi:MAG: hypothetical protein Q8N15_02275, partial [Bacillota bacterium]|nr:hypothetical protein [Bacillota bacterium]